MQELTKTTAELSGKWFNFNALVFGSPAVLGPTGPVALRPPIARGLPLSEPG